MNNTLDNPKYTFGTTNAAARRLEEMAKFFNPPAERWLAKFIKNPVKRALDLGSGPGFTTEMLSRSVRGTEVFGIEKSDEFLKMARERFPALTFIKHDLAAGPLPLQADIVYCRFLLSHLKEAGRRVNAWIDSLAPGGLLFVDEVEGINTDIPVFREYLEINEALVRSQGASLFIGGMLSKCAFRAETVSDETARIPVASWRAATWFYPNTVTIWESERYVRDNYPQARRRKISETLRFMMESRDAGVKTVWKMKRIVLKKKES